LISCWLESVSYHKNRSESGIDKKRNNRRIYEYTIIHLHENILKQTNFYYMKAGSKRGF
jgi:hypothetical protein